MSPERFARARELGIATSIWTLRRSEEIESFLSSGADAIVTDRPDWSVNAHTGKTGA